MNGRYTWPRLDIQDAPLADLPSPDELDIQTWTDTSGRVCALGGRDARGRWMHLPPLATFVFRDIHEPVSAYPTAGVARAAIEDAWWRTVIPMVLQVSGWEALHASAVATERGVVALCGPSGTGKTTTAMALQLRGLPMWADDAVVFKTAGADIRTLRIPSAPRLDSTAAEMLGIQVSRGPSRFDAGAGADEMPLRAVIILSRASDADAGATASRAEAGGALSALLLNALAFDLGDVERKRQMVDQYCRVADDLPVYELRFRPGRRYLQELLDTIQGAVGAG